MMVLGARPLTLHVSFILVVCIALLLVTSGSLRCVQSQLRLSASFACGDLPSAAWGPLAAQQRQFQQLRGNHSLRHASVDDLALPRGLPGAAAGARKHVSFSVPNSPRRADLPPLDPRDLAARLQAQPLRASFEARHGSGSGGAAGSSLPLPSYQQTQARPQEQLSPVLEALLSSVPTPFVHGQPGPGLAGAPATAVRSMLDADDLADLGDYTRCVGVGVGLRACLHVPGDCLQQARVSPPTPGSTLCMPLAPWPTRPACRLLHSVLSATRSRSGRCWRPSSSRSWSGSGRLRRRVTLASWRCCRAPQPRPSPRCTSRRRVRGHRRSSPATSSLTRSWLLCSTNTRQLTRHRRCSSRRYRISTRSSARCPPPSLAPPRISIPPWPSCWPAPATPQLARWRWEQPRGRRLQAGRSRVSRGSLASKQGRLRRASGPLGCRSRCPSLHLLRRLQLGAGQPPTPPSSGCPVCPLLQ